MSFRHLTLTVIAALIVTAGAISGFATAQEGHDAFLGSWEMTTAFQGQEIPTTMTLSIEEGKLVGVWASQGGEMTMADLVVEGAKLTFSRSMGRGGQQLQFEGTLEGDEINGKYVTGMGEMVCTGKRKQES